LIPSQLLLWVAVSNQLPLHDRRRKKL